MASPLRRLLKYLRRTPDRWRHRSRRAAAARQLHAGGVPKHIVVLCHGNLCRSPYAAAALRRRLEPVGNIRIESAGFFGPNRGCPAEALEAAAARAIDLTDHRSRTVDRALFEHADLVIVMDPAQEHAVRSRYVVPGTRMLVLGDMDPEPIRAREIKDPFGQRRAVFDECYDRIDRCVEQVVRSFSGAGEQPAY